MIFSYVETIVFIERMGNSVMAHERQDRLKRYIVRLTSSVKQHAKRNRKLLYQRGVAIAKESKVRLSLHLLPPPFLFLPSPHLPLLLLLLNFFFISQEVELVGIGCAIDRFMKTDNNVFATLGENAHYGCISLIFSEQLLYVSIIIIIIL